MLGSTNRVSQVGIDQTSGLLSFSQVAASCAFQAYLTQSKEYFRNIIHHEWEQIIVIYKTVKILKALSTVLIYPKSFSSKYEIKKIFSFNLKI